MKTNLITRPGWHKLDEELKYLWKVKRPQVTQAVSEAAALGDRSENAEYKEGKRELRRIDSRLRFLTKRLDALEIVDHHPQQNGKVFFGAWVELENDEGDIVRYRIVGTDEIDPKLGYITIDSPMARALIGKQVDDDVFVKTPSGTKEWWINLIQYTPFE
ncbi:transcription elongation factor GreB [Agarivorans sp. OAG1]|uniref:transcription elongation factor GreB n=1 Tax=unclassified Agarivorans TaxID=2636026 RepID=UPI00128D8895|nr:transcription elongation factor GreB [Agarivorans sp. B2Z047]MPW30015.1 transcription elongation factor GreB [Agarivorans sp. B2Z047]UQN43584.1 transcription elongation factor GreB [Agarivorans sp. B2Z047]BEU04885.1 transcription elongation factor GreB [Agarivorans sp. OAG1]